METTKPKIIFKTSYYVNGKLQVWRTAKSYAWFYWVTRAVPYLKNLGNKIDYLFINGSWPTTNA